MPSWVAPRTWVTGEVATAAEFNSNLRDNTLYLRSAHGCRVFKSGTQTVTTGNNDVVTFNSEDFDTDALHDTVTNNSRITVPTGFDGRWTFIYYADIDADTANHNGNYVLMLRKNAAGSSVGGTTLDSKSFIGHAIAQSGMLQWGGVLAAADYVEAFFASNTENRILQNNTAGTTLLAVYLGA